MHGFWDVLNVFERVVRCMPTFDVDVKVINVFEFEKCYMFKHFFQLDDTFEAVREFYNKEEYRFEVPRDAIDEVRERLVEYYYELKLVDNTEEFCVVMQRCNEYPKPLFRNAVLMDSRGDYKLFVLKDKVAVEQAILHGAKPISETSLNIGF